ncbi:MAG: hypothetical protein LQ346_003384 [Caloplaca aetnensis]|nr:MAG: hypothetical protein LQ346_003384 [Caloplaca aetnensis]
MHHTSPKEQPQSLSTTSPILNTNVTEDTLAPPPDNLLRTHRRSRSNAQLRECRVAAIQSAKREILANIKEDWIWPPPTQQLGGRFPRRRNSTRWRARDSDSSAVTSRSPSPSPGSQDPYRFESPDAVLPSFVSNRAKRRKLVQEESRWNQGLKTFTERRDFWTGAQPQLACSEQDRKKLEPNGSDTHVLAIIPTTPTDRQTDPAHQKNAPAAKQLGASDSDNSTSISAQSLDASASIFSSTLPSARTSQSSEPPSIKDASPNDAPPPASMTPEDPPPTLVPLAPPLLSPADHPNIMEITPATYATVYSKCVVQNLAPSVPINLRHVVGSLVQGWKDDGEWPPKSTTTEKEVAGVAKRDSLRGKMRGLRVDGEEVRLERVARRSVGKVKRVLGR